MLRSLLLCLLILAPSLALAETPVFLEDLTWTELRDRLHAGTTTILVPIGGTEQNGPHMALGKHNVRARFLAEKIARQLGNALVAPVIAYVPEGNFAPPTGHMRFPGTISITEETYEKLLDGAARSFQAAGFHDIIFLGDHGSDVPGARAVADRLNRAWASSNARVHAIEDYYRTAQHGFAKMLVDKGYKAEAVGTHAGLADTSLTMAIDPSLVRADKLHAGANIDGTAGDPGEASAALGQLGVDAIVSATVAAIRKAEQRP